MVSNPNYYSKSHTNPNAQITDGVDFPHTGIIKALSDGLGQNYAISGFDITIDSATQIDVGAGVIFRDGKRLAVAAVNNLTLSSTYTNGYHLLIANSHATAPVLTIRNPTAANLVPEYTAGDTIIAVITHNGTANVGIQYLTLNKTENNLSIGYDDSGYTETLSVVSDAGHTDITAKVADKDIRFKGTDSSSAITALTLDMSEAGLAAFNGNIKVGGNIIQASDGGSTITLDASDNVTIGNNLKVGGNEIQASDGGSTITMDTSDNVTIGGGLTTTTDLTVNGGDINYGNAQDSTLKVAATTSSTAGRDLTIEAGSTATNGSNINGGDLHLKSGGGDGTGTSIMTFSTKIADTDTVVERMRIHTDGKVGIGTNSPDNLLEVQNSDATTNAIVYPFKLTETTSGTATHGLGVGMKFEVENASGTQKETSYITSSLATATNGAEMGQLDLHVGKVYPGTSYAINPAITMLGKFPAHVATRETWGIAHQWGESNSIKVAGGANPSGGGTPGSLFPQKLSLLDTSVGSNTYFQLWALPTGSSPVAYSIPHGFTMTLKNIGHQTATIYSGHVQEHIDFGQTSNAFISAANTISLPAMATITIMAYGDANETHIKLQDILDGYDTNNYSNYDEGAATGEGWLVISQTG